MREGKTDEQMDHLTPKEHAQRKAEWIESPRGRLLIASCRSGSYLARKVTERVKLGRENAGEEGDILHLEDIDFQFSDGETCVRLDADVNGRDVILFQALHDPTSARGVDENYVAFLIAVRTLCEWGANHVTGVLPYLAYARQDKPTKFRREPTTADLMADLSIEAGLDRLVTWDPHTDQIRGFYGGIRWTA
jgi:ribose-phosphate pyrophosphokinase